MHATWRYVAVALSVLAFAPGVLARQKESVPRPKPGAKAPADALADGLRARVDEALRALEGGGDFGAGLGAVQGVFDAAVAYGDPADKALFVDISYAVRLVALAGAEKGEARVETLRYLRANEGLARAIVMLMRPEDDRAGVCRVLKALRDRQEKNLAKHPDLVAALCVVHDRPQRAGVAGADRRAPAPEDLMAYYVKNEGKMLFDPDTLPGEQLVFMVDSTSPIPEMSWALSKYAGNRNVGKRFFEVTYDTRAYKQGADKRVAEAGVTLENIRRVGGVCAEQAYFATEVGKAVGAPTAYVVGRGGEDLHAWVGYLERTPRGAKWNFDEGRYDDYEDVRGNIEDPQTGAYISDGDLAVSAFGMDAPKESRWFAVAMIDAARRLAAIEKGKLPYPPAAPEALGKDAAARPNTAGARLDLLQSGLRASPGCVQAWQLVEEVGRSAGISSEQRSRWFDAVNALCGKQNPEFCLDLMSALIEGEGDAGRRRDAWAWLSGLYNGRQTLVARVKLAEGASAERHADPKTAMACYQELIARYPNEGPFVVDAAAGGVRLMKAAGSPEREVAFLKDAWQRIKRPGRLSKAAARQSSFYRVGRMYLNALEGAGMKREADSARKQLEALEQ